MYLLPQPKTVQMKQGLFSLRSRGDIRMAEGCKEEALCYGLLLKREIAEQLGADYAVKTVTCDSERKCHKGSIVLDIRSREDKSGESYYIGISEQRIDLIGYGTAGLLYAVQTLRQLIRIYGAMIPALEIEDEPSIPNRGFYQDVSRGRIPTLKYLKELADTCSFYKLNQLQLYVEDSYLFEDFGETWREDTPLTAEEILELDRYCTSLQIELVPSLASFGHLYGVLRTRQYGHLCELEQKDAPFYLTERMEHHTVDVSCEESFRMVADRIRDYMKLFRSNKFNLCADETFDLGKGKSKALAEEKGETEIYLMFLEKLCKVVTDAGRIPMFWGDIIVKNAECLSRLPKESICLNWEYDPNVREKNTRTFVNAGAKHLYVCPGVQSWHDLMNRHHAAYENISGMCRLAHKYQVEGVLNTCWGDLGHVAHAEFATIGLAYGAVFSWSDKELEEEKVNSMISLLSYGDRTGKVVQRLAKLSECQTIRWWNMVACKEWLQKKERTRQECARLISPNKEQMTDNLCKREKLVQQLYRDMLSVDVRYRGAVMANLLMAEGQTLLEKACIYVANSLLQPDPSPTKHKAPTGSGEVPATGGNELARELEEWLVAYKKLWRSVSKESQLHRVVDVVCWYADYLRTL